MSSNLVKNNGHGTFSTVLLSQLVIDSMIKHLFKFSLSLVSGSIESLESLDISNPLLDDSVSGFSDVSLSVGNAISSNINKHVFISSGVDQAAYGCLGDGARANPKWVNRPVLIKDINALGEVLDGYKHVLVNVVVLELLVDTFDGEELEEGHLGGDQPTESVSEEWVVSK